MTDAERTRRKENKQKSLIRVFLGERCNCCGVMDTDILQFDHINNDGYLFRDSKNKGRGWSKIWMLFKTNPNEFASVIQLLCANCNTKKESYRREFDRLETLNTTAF